VSVPAFVAVAALGVAVSVSGSSTTSAGRIAFSAQPARDLYRQRVLAVGERGGRPVVVAGAQAAQVAVSGDGRRIAFVRDNADVWIANADGSGARLVAEDASAPSWSPSGAMLAYIRGIPGGVVEVLDLSSGTKRDFYDSWVGGIPSWSPDGRRLAYSYDKPRGETGLVVADLSTGVQKVVGEGLGPEWSPSGDLIASTVCSGASTPGGECASAPEIEITTADGAHVAWIGGSGAAWSPNGRALSYIVSTPEGNRLAVTSPTGGRRTLLGATDTVPAWSRDGRKLLVAVNRPHSGEVDAVDVASHARVRLRSEPEMQIDQVAWAGGRALFVLERIPQSSRVVLARPGGGLVVLTHSSLSDDEPAWSPDGRRLAFVRGEAGVGGEIWVVDADGRHQHRLTPPPRGAADWSPSWSPDGRRIAFVRDWGISGNFLIVADVGTGRARIVASDVHEQAGRAVAWSPRGNVIALAGANGIQLFRLDGRVERSLDVSGTDLAWSPDGNMLALTSSGGITVMDASGANQRQIGGSGAQEPTWSPDGRRVAFALFVAPSPYGLILPNQIATIALDGTDERIVAERFGARDPAWQSAR
jgi:Tol biopolymer transport system component